MKLFRKLIFLPFLLLLFYIGYSQKSSVTGTVYDTETGEALIGVNVSADKIGGTATDENGYFNLYLPKGIHNIQFSYIGYKDFSKEVTIAEGEQRTLIIHLLEKNTFLNDVVVTAGRYEQRLGDVVTSLEVIKPELIENVNAESMDVALNKVPGINIADGQASIRGGGGYSYGAGSRVLLLINDLPLISPDAGDIKWNFIPLENIEQVEIIKGASSALYGSSALNGVINVRTKHPGSVPETKVNYYSGLYTSPKRKELKWWGDENRFYSGFSLSHSRIIGNTDLIVGTNLFNDPGYRTNNHENRIRTNMSLKHRSYLIKGLSYGVSANYMYQDKTDFLLWKNAQEGAYIQFEDAVSPATGSRMSIDPHISFYNENGNKHSLKSRYYRTVNNIEGDNLSSTGESLFTEYRYHHKFKNDLRITGGISYIFSEIKASLYGDHTSSNYAVFMQSDKKFFDVLSLSFGLRWENYKLDRDSESSRPLLRLGANYQIAEFTFLRTSFGQGYRFPSIAEKFTFTQLGGLQILPSPQLESESGWSYEAGLKQGFRVSDWSGFIDFSFFWTEYKEMMEFTFGVYDSLTYEQIFDIYQYGNNPVGFQSQNVGLAQIIGVELVLTGKGKIGRLPVSFMAGYSYTNPIDMNSDSTYLATKSNSNNILKYRFFHSAKANVDVGWKEFSFGTFWTYNSNVENIDAFFESGIVLPGLKQYREEHNSGYHQIDCNLSFTTKDNSKLSLILKNVTNEEIMVRPGYILPPRTIVLQYSLKI